MKTAKAAVYTGHGKPFEIAEYPVTEPQKDCARLKLVASGVCGTDVHIHDGCLGGDARQIIGHEFIGTIDACDEAEAARYGLKIGDNVIACIAVPCGHCKLCQNGDMANCVHMGVTNGGDPETAPYFHGGYGDYNFSPLSTLVKIPADVDPVAAAVFACAGPTGLHAFKLAARANIDVTAVKTAVVQGLGPVGLFSALYLAAKGVPYVAAVTGRKNAARAALAESLGVSTQFALAETPAEQVAAAVAAENDGLGADLCVEASGNPAAFAQGMSYLRNRGVYLVPGQYSVSGGTPVSPEVITFKALQIIGSSQYDMDDIHSYVAFLQENPALTAKFRDLIAAYPVERVNEAFADIKAGKNVKTMLMP